MGIRAQLENGLTEYVKDTLGYIETIRDFCNQQQEWTSKRKAELEKMRHIIENQQGKEKELSAVLKDTLEGLKKLEPFLEAVEKLAVTSSHVFSGQIFLLCGESPERVQSVITDARTDAPLLIHFKRDAETFFQPLLDNVHILVFQLDNYVLTTEQLCSRVRQNSVLCGHIYKCKTGQPSVQLILNASENTMHQMLDHLNQLCEIRRNKHTRLAFLFQENAQKFIDVFSERRSRMRQFLTDLEETADKLDSVKKNASISTVVGSSVGILGGGFGIAAVLAPFTAGASLAWAFAVAGIGLGITSVVDTLVTEITETQVNHHHERKAQSYINSYKDDMIKIEYCLKEVANSERPLVKPSAVDAMTVSRGTGEVLSKGVDGFAAYAGHKSERVTEAATEFAMEELNTARDVPQVATYLSRTEQLANAKTLRIVKGARVASGFVNAFFIGLDSYLIVKESISLANGSKSEVSELIRSRAALWKSELEAWEKMYDSLCKGIKMIRESQDTLEKPFLP